MLRSIGKFTVLWNRKGSVFYTAWFDSTAEFLHCKRSLRRGTDLVSFHGDDCGVLEKAEFLLFPGTGTVDKPTQEILRQLPHPFFVSQCLRQSWLRGVSQKVFREPSPETLLRPTNENFVFPETRSEH